MAPAAETAVSPPLQAEGPQTVIEPRKGWLPVDWREFWRYRELLYFLTWRDLKVRYKQTVLGFLWGFIQPFAQLVVFSVVFGRLAQLDSEGVPYPVFVYAGLLPWQFFQSSLTRSSNSVVGNAGLITKVYFPRLIVPIASIGAGLIDFAISFVILIGLMVYYGYPPTTATLMVAPLVLLTIVSALAVGTFLSALSVAYRDFRYAIPFMMRLWFFATPVVWSLEKVPEKWRWVMALNPMVGVVDAYRAAIILEKPFAWTELAISTAVSLGVLQIGLMYFRRIEKSFADII